MANKRMSVVIDADTRNFTANVNQMKKTMSQATSEISKATSQPIGGMEKLSSSLTNVGGVAMSLGGDLTKKLTLPLVGVGTAIAKIGKDFEKQMSVVQAVSGATGVEMDKLEAIAREMGKTTAFSATEAAQGLEYMALAGWDVETMTASLPSVLKLATAGNIDLGRASDLVTDSMSAMGLGADDLSRYLDVVAQTSRSANTSTDEMMDVYVKAGGIFRGLGVPIEQSAVAIGMLANAGIKGSEAGTGLTAVMTNLTAPTGQAKKALDELGFSAFDSEGNFKGLDTVLFELQGSLAGMTEEQKTAYLAMIGGKGNVDVLNALLNGLGDSYDDLTEDISNSEGALNDMEKTMTNNLQGALDSLKSSLSELALSFYEVGEGPIKVLVEWLTRLVDKFSGLSTETQQWIAIGGALLALLGPLTWAFGAVATAIGFLLSPVGLTIAGIGALIGVFTLLYSKMSDSTAFETLKTAFKTATALITSDTTEAFNNLMWGSSDLGTHIGIVVAEIVGHFKSIGDVFKQVWEGVKAVTNSLVAPVMNWLKENQKDVQKTLMDVWKAISKTIESVVKTISEIINTIFTHILNFIEDNQETIMQIIDNAWIAIKATFDILTNVILPIVVSAFNAIKGIVEAVMPVIMSIIGLAMDIIAGDWGNVWNRIKEILDNTWEAIKAIVKVGISFVKDIIIAGWELIKTLTSATWEYIKKIISSIWDAIKDVISNRINSVKSTIDSVWNAIKTVTSTVWNAIKTVIDTVWSGIKTGVSTAVNGVKTSVSTGFNSVKTTATTTWNSIKSAITKPITEAYNKVKEMVGKIKSAMNFSWSLPKLKMPSFGVSGKFGVNPPSVPKFNLKWMATGGIATGPSIVGVGEAGDEAILPLSNKSKMKPFAHAVASLMPQNNGGGGNSSGGDTIITGNTFHVREEADIKKIAQELKRLDDKESRARGRRAR